MSSKNSPIITAEDLKKEIQGARCREALRCIDVPEHIIAQFQSGPLLFQFAHMSIFLEVPWRDALTWVNDHKGEILKYGELTHEQKSTATGSPNRAANGIDVGPTRKR